MKKILQRLQSHTLLLYLEDNIVVAREFETHLHRLGELFSRLRAASLRLKASKFKILKEQVHYYLRHIVGMKVVATDPERLEFVKQWEAPRNLKEWRAFLAQLATTVSTLINTLP